MTLVPQASPNIKTGRTTAKIIDSFGLIVIDITSDSMSINGARTRIRIIIIYEFCILVTSVVSLVTRFAVLKRSRFLKLKFSTL